MSKKTWFVIILTLAVIAILAASKLVAGFDAWAQDTIIGPAWAGVLGLIAAITSHPLYLQYGFQAGLVLGIIGTAIFALILWPKIRSPTQKVTTTLQDKIRTTPTQIPAAPQPTPVATTPAAPAESVEAEE